MRKKKASDFGKQKRSLSKSRRLGKWGKWGKGKAGDSQKQLLNYTHMQHYILKIQAHSLSEEQNTPKTVKQWLNKSKSDGFSLSKAHQQRDIGASQRRLKYSAGIYGQSLFIHQMRKNNLSIVVALALLYIVMSQSLIIPDNDKRSEKSETSEKSDKSNDTDSSSNQAQKAKAYLNFKNAFKQQAKSKPKVEQTLAQLTFQKNYDLIKETNNNPNKTYKMAINKFSDIPTQIFINTYLRLQVPATVKQIELAKNPNVTFTGVQGLEAGNAVDWTTKAAVTSVKYQGVCGSCWAFSAAGAVESALIIKNKKKYKDLDLSEQELLDCSVSYGGCNGGWMDNAFDYIEEEGINSESKYPYSGINQACQRQNGAYSTKGKISFTGCDSLTLAIRSAPVAVAVDASNWSQYSSGVLNDCGSSHNHGVLLVGYSKSYWKIKNSWGVNWGESGFIKIYTNDTCGICTYPSIPLV